MNFNELAGLSLASLYHLLRANGAKFCASRIKLNASQLSSNTK